MSDSAGRVAPERRSAHRSKGSTAGGDSRDPIVRYVRIAVAVIVPAMVLALGIESFLRKEAVVEGPGDSFVYPMDEVLQNHPDPEGYAETDSWIVSVPAPRAIASGPGDRVYVAGESNLAILDSGGRELSTIDLEEPAYCIDVDDREKIYIGFKDHVETYETPGEKHERWAPAGGSSWLTSIQVVRAGDGGYDVYLADAGQRIVFRYTGDGMLTGIITGGSGDGEPGAGGSGGFVVPSPWFDVIALSGGGMWIVNPGRKRVDRYGPGGRYVAGFGRSSSDVAGFCGCCNPVNIALLPDGNLVTCEKGISRVKVMSPEGGLVALVAGPKQFRIGNAVLDVAVDSRGRILVLDPTAGAVRVFEAEAQS